MNPRKSADEILREVQGEKGYSTNISQSKSKVVGTGYRWDPNTRELIVNKYGSEVKTFRDIHRINNSPNTTIKDFQKWIIGTFPGTAFFEKKDNTLKIYKG